MKKFFINKFWLGVVLFFLVILLFLMVIVISMNY